MKARRFLKILIVSVSATANASVMTCPALSGRYVKDSKEGSSKLIISQKACTDVSLLMQWYAPDGHPTSMAQLHGPTDGVDRVIDQQGDTVTTLSLQYGDSSLVETSIEKRMDGSGEIHLSKWIETIRNNMLGDLIVDTDAFDKDGVLQSHSSDVYTKK